MPRDDLPIVSQTATRSIPHDPLNKTRTTLWMAFYNLIAIPFLFVALHLLVWLAGNTRAGAKIKQGKQGRKNVFLELERQLRACTTAGPAVWVHASSMGECEQAKPLLREIGRRFPQAVRVLTIFSPSAQKHLSSPDMPAEATCYLPLDTLPQVRRFLDLVQPVAGIVIRHDYWPNFMWQAQGRGIFLLLADASVSANARTKRFWPGVRSFHREVLANFDLIGAVSPQTAEYLRPLLRHPERVRVLGDTRFDQVLYRTQNADLSKILPEKWRAHTPIFVAGSTWPSDEEVLLPAFAQAREQSSDLKMILVPHEPRPNHLLEIEQALASLQLSCARLSQANSTSSAEVLLVDRVGVLAELYGAGEMAFVGGSFGPGVHSVLEAAAHGIPVLFGPRMTNSAEAIEMKELGIGRVIANVEDCRRALLALLQNQPLRQELGEKNRAFVASKAGAAQRLVDLLQPLLGKHK